MYLIVCLKNLALQIKAFLVLKDGLIIMKYFALQNIITSFVPLLEETQEKV